MSSALGKFGSCVVQSALDGTSCKVESFWKDQACIISLFRRLGCKFCRLEAANLSSLKSALDKRNIRLVGISFDKDGVKDFIDGKFFSGDLYLDPDRKTYEALSFKRVSMFTGFCSLFTKAGRDLNSEANAAHITGNLSGDGWQTGGLLVIGKDGNVLYEFAQEQVVNHPDYAKILQVLQIDPNEVPKMNTAVCGDDSCTKP
ncbi:Prostamide/prostaglandin F synthase [Fasciolopsis buskii]|uniref:Prostamide/prostaglandin F synthase n=1 Tax=Fasciolopsis buskii TaxID=27845 RepID=A0A8E0RK00_9TREM|nr:Prostamide/prostaglandin F synthase [Fasciolopsis buski]